MSDALARWDEYLQKLPSADGVTEAQVGLVKAIWSKVVERYGTKATPPAAGLFDGRIFFVSWDIGPHYLEFELSSDGTVEWFYKNRETGELEGTTGDAETAIDDRAIGYVGRLREAI